MSQNWSDVKIFKHVREMLCVTSRQPGISATVTVFELSIVPKPFPDGSLTSQGPLECIGTQQNRCGVGTVSHLVISPLRFPNSGPPVRPQSMVHIGIQQGELTKIRCLSRNAPWRELRTPRRRRTSVLACLATLTKSFGNSA